MNCLEVKGYPGYLIYEDGRVYSKKTRRFLKQCLNRGGYPTVNLSHNGEYKSHRIHRLVAEHFLQKVEGLTDVNHIDGIKTNNHISNLEWSNKSLNGKHAYRLGLNTASPQLGENHGMSVLTEQDIIEIRRKSEIDKLTYLQIAKQYDISKQQVWRICKRKCWSHIK